MASGCILGLMGAGMKDNTHIIRSMVKARIHTQTALNTKASGWTGSNMAQESSSTPTKRSRGEACGTKESLNSGSTWFSKWTYR